VKFGALIFAATAAMLYGAGALAQNQDLLKQDSQKQDTQNTVTEGQPAPPSPAADTTTTMAGAWEFSNADHDKICHFTFRTDAVTGGSKLDVDKNCPNLFPSTKDIVAWARDNYGSLRLLDAQGNAVIELTEVESGMFDGFTPEEGRYILQTAAATAPTRSAADLTGDWGVSRGTGKPICVITLANSQAGNDVLALKIKPGCDATVTQFNPVAWRMEEGELVLLSPRGQSWQFEETDTNTWQRVPESPDLILLVRQ
jgi:hypothetical protein